MIKRILLILVFLIPMALMAQETKLDIFRNLVDKEWYAEGTWGDGSSFKQTVRMKFSLDRKLIVVESDGYTNQEQTAYGQRNHGIRQYDNASESIRFWEFDIFGGLTEGTVSHEVKNIYYHYNYGGTELTEVWEYVDDHTYNYIIGSYSDGVWAQKYLSTQFKAK